jgi:hypothetical protein
MSGRSQFAALLYTQWKHQRHELIVFAIVGGLIAPACLWDVVGSRSGGNILGLIGTAGLIGALGSVLAIATGLVLAIRPFVLDAQSKHTYPLALPVTRTHYTLLRVASGMTLVLLPTTGFLIGSLVAAQALPPSYLLVRAYPFGLALRFLLATITAFAIGFGVQYGFGRRAARIIVITAITVAGFEVLGQLVLHGSVTAPLWQLLLSNVSPFRVFFTRWMLFDV